MNGDGFRDFLTLLKRLEAANIAFTLCQAREDALMIQVVVPGERWEIELLDHGDELEWEIERFVSNGTIEDETALDDLFARFSDEEPGTNHDNSRE